MCWISFPNLCGTGSFLMVGPAQPNPLTSPQIDCLGNSLWMDGWMDWATASTFPDLRAVRGRPDLGASSRLLPDRSLDLIRRTVLNPTPQSNATCASDFPDPAVGAGAPRQAVFSADNPWLKVDGKGHRRFCGVSGHRVRSPRSSFRRLTHCQRNRLYVTAVNMEPPELNAHPVYEGEIDPAWQCMD